MVEGRDNLPTGPGGPRQGEVLQRFRFDAQGLGYDSWFVRSGWLPPTELTSAAFGLIFDGDAILLARLVDRGWEVPGGHLEPGESAEEAMRREVLEETGVVVGGASVFAHQRIRLLSPRPDGYRYPYPEGYQVFFRAEMDKRGLFVATKESAGTRFCAPDEARRTSWVRRHPGVYDAALADATVLSGALSQ